jgi:hypothetical protein
MYEEISNITFSFENVEKMFTFVQEQYEIYMNSPYMLYFVLNIAEKKVVTIIYKQTKSIWIKEGVFSMN